MASAAAELPRQCGDDQRTTLEPRRRVRLPRAAAELALINARRLGRQPDLVETALHELHDREGRLVRAARAAPAFG